MFTERESYLWLTKEVKTNNKKLIKKSLIAVKISNNMNWYHMTLRLWTLNFRINSIKNKTIHSNLKKGDGRTVVDVFIFAYKVAK